MSTLNFIITDAGRQAAIDADALGIKLIITEVVYGTGNWSPDKTATALQNQFKPLPAGGGENPVPLYVHIAVTDQSSDTYQANEVGIYAGDVLFAIWSKGLQPDMDGPGKINTGDSAFVFDLLLENVPPDSVTVGDANFSVPLSTETVPGIIQRATLEDMLALINDDAITVQKFKAWWDSVKDSLTDRIIGNELYFLGKKDPRFFLLDGSTIPNGVIDYPKLANSGSPFFNISGNNLILMDIHDFIRPVGSSSRSAGYYEGDAIRNIYGSLSITDDNDISTVRHNTSGAFYGVEKHAIADLGDKRYNWGYIDAKFDASRVVPTANENRPISRSSFLGIWHGEELK